jgi:ABC-2 type transport system ATP-binding protein
MTVPAPVLQATAVGKRFGFKWALRDCTLTIPAGKVAAIVGPNGAGKSTLLRLAAGLSRPSKGTIEVLGDSPSDGRASFLRRIGYLDQERPLLQGFRVDEMLRFGAGTNSHWDQASALSYLEELRIPLDQRVGTLSGGQQAQVALTVCLAKQPELLILDEPAAELDPVAREDLLRLLMQQVAQSGTSVLLATHALGDVAAICDYLVIVSDSHVVLCDDIDYIMESHRMLTAFASDGLELPSGATAIDTHSSGRSVSHLTRLEMPVTDERWSITEPTLQEIVMAYLRKGMDRTLEPDEGNLFGQFGEPQ